MKKFEINFNKEGLYDHDIRKILKKISSNPKAKILNINHNNLTSNGL